MLDLCKIILLNQYFFLFGLCILKYNFVNNLEKDSYSNKMHTLQLSQTTKLFKFIIFLQVFFAAHSVWFFSEWQISTYCTRLFLCCICTCTKAGQTDELWCRFRYLDMTETVPGKEESGTLTCDKVQVSLLEKSASYFVLAQQDIVYHLQQNAS